jgi:L-threonylcarbamoyladenylate synthase
LIKTTQSECIHKASKIINNGGIIAYPTEGVYGLGCLPEDSNAVFRILNIKHRDQKKGLIIIASDIEQLEKWTTLSDNELDTILREQKIITWIVKKNKNVPYWVSGEHETIAIRLTKHPIAAALCATSKSALISTSANITGEEPPKNQVMLRSLFGDVVDYIVPGDCDSEIGASTIKILTTGEIIRS